MQSNNNAKIAEEIRRIAGAENASAKPDALLAYSFDASPCKGTAPLLVAWPKNAKEVQAIARLASKRGIAVVPRGAGTGEVGGAVPNGGIVLDLTKMNSFSVSEKQKTAKVQCGTVLAKLNEALSEKNLEFPVQPSSHRICTIGGMVATNAAGLRAIKFGRTSEWVKELKIIDGKGRLVTLSGLDAKNFCGTEGTCGIAVEATLALREKGGKTRHECFELETFEEVAKKAQELAKTSGVQAVEFLDRHTSNALGMGNNLLLLAEFEGGEQADAARSARGEDAWKRREGAFPTLAAQGFGISEDPLVPVEKMPRFLEWLEQNKIPCYGHIGIGVLHPRFPASGAEKKMREMHALAKSLGGSASGEHGIGLLKKEFADSDFKQKIRKLKQKFDPKNVLNPGKII